MSLICFKNKYRIESYVPTQTSITKEFVVEEKDNVDEMKLAQDRASAFNLAKDSYELLHEMTCPGYLSQRVFNAMNAHKKIMHRVIEMVDEFKNPEAIMAFKELVGLKGDESGEGSKTGSEVN